MLENGALHGVVISKVKCFFPDHFEVVTSHTNGRDTKKNWTGLPLQLLKKEDLPWWWRTVAHSWYRLNRV